MSDTLLALVVLTGAVGAECFVGNLPPEDFFKAELFHCVHFFDVMRLIIVVRRHRLKNISEESYQHVGACHRETVVVIRRNIVAVGVEHFTVAAAHGEVQFQIIF